MSKIYWLNMDVASIHINGEETATCDLCHKVFKNDSKLVDDKTIDWYSFKKHFIKDHLTRSKKKE